MNIGPETRLSLLIRIQDDQDQHAWAEFVDIYWDLIYRFGRKKGLQEADALDLTQEVLCALRMGIKKFKYDPDRGSFKSWLLKIAHNERINLVKRRRPEPVGSGDSGILARQPSPEDSVIWEEEFLLRLLECALDRVKARCRDSKWEAFWLTAVAGKKPAEVARALSMSVGAVYIARSRVLELLRAEIEQMQQT
jgi:RNA polymerase sigma-70 factor (ECF subfamily)